VDRFSIGELSPHLVRWVLERISDWLIVGCVDTADHLRLILPRDRMRVKGGQESCRGTTGEDCDGLSCEDGVCEYGD